MAHGCNDVPRPRLALGANHGRAFPDAAQPLTERSGAANERDGEVALDDVEVGVGRRQHFRLVNHVHSEGLEHARLGGVADAALGHHRNRGAVDNFANLLRLRHARNAAFGTDIGRHAFERHDGDGAGVLGDGRLLRIGNVHDDAAFLHAGEAALHQFRAVSQRM